MTKWIGDVTDCDVCHDEIQGHFIDGKTIYGPWALMCDTCHGKVGVGLGTGYGQRYNLETREKVLG